MEMASNDILMGSFNDGIYPEIIGKVGSPNTPDSQFAMWLNATFRTTETLFLQWQSGHLPDDIWFGYHQGMVVSFASNRTYADQWRLQKNRYSASFRAYIDALIIEAEERRASFLAAD
jgi:hypothetical protein